LKQPAGITRRSFLGGAAATLAAGSLAGGCAPPQRWDQPTFIGRVAHYQSDVAGVLRRGFAELGVRPVEVRGKRILLKPNLVETLRGSVHINTHPLVLRGAIEAFLGLGAAQVMVGEGPGHRRDTRLVVEEAGLVDVLREDRIRFVDLNYEDALVRRNEGGNTPMAVLLLPRILEGVDWVVSVAKLKTHHWTGVTLSLKNLFGLMPGLYYGWPKNVLHWAGIEDSILDIYATVRPHFAIVDGVVGMEGDGPIMGSPRQAGVVIMGRSLPAVDATCARIMQVAPERIPYLARLDGSPSSLAEQDIEQVGESIASVTTRFALVEGIPAHRGIRG
jgi:uncharacterized protein (DUF362 family)